MNTWNNLKTSQISKEADLITKIFTLLSVNQKNTNLVFAYVFLVVDSIMEKINSIKECISHMKHWELLLKLVMFYPLTVSLLVTW